MDSVISGELKKLIKGKIVYNEKLSGHTTFGIGGPVSAWVEPRDTIELRKITAFARAHGVPCFVIGSGSNLLVNDKGFDGIVIHLGSSHFRKVKISGTTVTVGAGYPVSGLVRLCCEEGLAGLESLVGIPGTVGGAVYMNAGGSSNPIFSNIGDFISSVRVMDHNGKIKRLKKDEIEFGYRRSSLEDCTILGVVLKLVADDKKALLSRCSKFLTMKRQKQVLDMRSAGCIFKNPENFQFTCGQMIDMLGLKGTKVGGAEVSEKHANFIVNRQNARCEDVMTLIKILSDKVKDNYNISLELEIKML